MTKSEWDKMIAGELYRGFDPELASLRERARDLMRQFNASPGGTPANLSERLLILKQLLGGFDAADPPFIEPPFAVDYGSNIYLGKDIYINFNCCFLDCNTIRIGDRCLFGPNVQLYPPGHPLDAHVRKGTKGPEFAHPITIGNDCWFGGSVIVLGGVTIGDGVVVGAGSVVTKDVESFVVVAGNPARIIRRLDPPNSVQDSKQTTSKS